MSRTKFSTSSALALAAVVLSSSTAVYAVAALPKHSVGKKQLKTAAVTNSKIRTHAVSGSKVAPGTFVSAQRMAFGKASGVSTGVTVLSLPRVGVTVRTNGVADQVAVTLPHVTAASPQWYVNSSGNMMHSTPGGVDVLSAEDVTTRQFTANIWRNDSTPAIYLHCVFDTTGFSGARPLSCWAMST
jgi:hypothetical protein